MTAAEPVRYLVALLTGPAAPVDDLRRALVGLLGPVADESEPIAFAVGGRFEAELGPDLARRFLAFERLARPEEMLDVARAVAAIDAERLAPFYLDHHKLVGATGRGAGHEIHLGHGVWVAPLLRFRKRRWQPFDWTPTDLADGRYDAFLKTVRKGYLEWRRASSA